MTTSRVLLDHQGPAGLREEIRKAIEAEPQTTVTDLHLWQIGPGIYSLALTVVAADPKPGSTIAGSFPVDKAWCTRPSRRL